MNTTLESELRGQIRVLRVLADRVISAPRGPLQTELFCVADALAGHLPRPERTAEEKILHVRAALCAHYERLATEPEKAPQHFAALRSAVETIVGRKEAMPGVVVADLTAEQMSGATVASGAHLAVGQCHTCVVFTDNPKDIGNVCLRFVNGKNCQGIFEPLKNNPDPSMKVDETDGAPSDASAVFDEIESWRSRAGASEKERDELKARLEQSKRGYEAQYERLEKTAAARETLQREVGRLTRERDQLREDLSDAFSELKKEKAPNDRLRRQVEFARGALASIQDLVSASQDETKQLVNKIASECEANIEALDGEEVR